MKIYQKYIRDFRQWSSYDLGKTFSKKSDQNIIQIEKINTHETQKFTTKLQSNTEIERLIVINGKNKKQKEK